MSKFTLLTLGSLALNCALCFDWPHMALLGGVLFAFAILVGM